MVPSSLLRVPGKKDKEEEKWRSEGPQKAKRMKEEEEEEEKDEPELSPKALELMKQAAAVEGKMYHYKSKYYSSLVPKDAKRNGTITLTTTTTFQRTVMSTPQRDERKRRERGCETRKKSASRKSDPVTVGEKRLSLTKRKREEGEEGEEGGRKKKRSRDESLGLPSRAKEKSEEEEEESDEAKEKKKQEINAALEEAAKNHQMELIRLYSGLNHRFWIPSKNRKSTTGSTR